jgi:hypothetical protein
VFRRDQILTAGYGWITLVPGWRAGTIDRTELLTGGEVSQVLDDIQRNGTREDLLLLYQAATGMDALSRNNARDEVVAAAAQSALSSGRLLLFRGRLGALNGPSSQGGWSGQTSEDRLIAAVMDERTSLVFEGRRYLFLPAERWYGPSAVRDYVPLREDDARGVLAGMATKFATAPDEQASWAALTAAIADPRSTEGILLLRRIPTSIAPAPRSGGPAQTPSQIAPKVAELDWIEIHLEFEDGSPFDGNCTLAVPGGKESSGPPGSGGVVRVDNIDTGSCKLSFPDLT